MSPDERDRILRVEIYVEEMSKDIASIKQDVKEMKLHNAKIGGIMLALTMIGAFVGWFLTQIKALKGLFV